MELSWKYIHIPDYGEAVAVQIGKTTKVKDLPLWFKPIFEFIPGGLPPLRFAGGKFFYLTWRQKSPLYWPDAIEEEIFPGDWLVAQDNGGVRHVREKDQLIWERESF